MTTQVWNLSAAPVWLDQVPEQLQSRVALVAMPDRLILFAAAGEDSDPGLTAP